MISISWGIDRRNPETIKSSFTRIAKELFKAAIKVNNNHFRITEIEFYYWCPCHQDNTTHYHEQLGGHWRMHTQGLDITLESGGDKDTGHNGGILIRGIYDDNHPTLRGKDKPLQYVNGPRKVLFRLFEKMKEVSDANILQLIPGHFPEPDKIHIAKRHGLKPYDGGKDKKYEIDDTQINYLYRYFTDKEHLYNEAYWINAEAEEL